MCTNAQPFRSALQPGHSAPHRLAAISVRHASADTNNPTPALPLLADLQRPPPLPPLDPEAVLDNLADRAGTVPDILLRRFGSHKALVQASGGRRLGPGGQWGCLEDIVGGVVRWMCG